MKNMIYFVKLWFFNDFKLYYKNMSNVKKNLDNIHYSSTHTVVTYRRK